MSLKEQSMIRCQQVKDYLASGQSVATWCSENNLKISTLHYWLTKYKRETKGDLNHETFVELKQASTKEVPVIIKIGVVSIELYPGFQAETLRKAIAAIRAL